MAKKICRFLTSVFFFALLLLAIRYTLLAPPAFAACTFPPPNDPSVSCNSVTVTVTPDHVRVGDPINFKIISGDASTYYGDNWSGGINLASCTGDWTVGGPGKTCTASASGVFTWTHTWHRCTGPCFEDGDRCSADECSTPPITYVVGCKYANSTFPCDACPSGYKRQEDIYRWADDSAQCDLVIGACIFIDEVQCGPIAPPPPTADIKANGSDGPINIAYNTSATLSWSSTNATSCSVTPGGWTGTSGSQSTGNLISSLTYTLSCTGLGGTANDSVTVNISPPCSAIGPGSNQLTGCLWDGINFDIADGDAPSGPVLSSPVPLSATALDQNWVDTAPNAFVGADTFSARWQGNFNFDVGGTYTFYAGSDDGIRVYIDGALLINSWINRPYTEQSFNKVFPAPGNHLIQIDYFENASLAQVKLYWTFTPAPPPTADIKANGSDGPITIPYNTSATLSWTSTDAITCSVTPGGFSGTSGSRSTGNLTSSRTYTLSCDGAGGNKTDLVIVNVSAPPPPVCGNGILEPPGEACDDGNTTSGDGCSSSCAIEIAPSCGIPPGGANWRWKTPGVDGYVCSSLVDACDPGNACIGYPRTCNTATHNWDETFPTGECTTLCFGFCACPALTCSYTQPSSTCPAPAGSPSLEIVSGVPNSIDPKKCDFVPGCSAITCYSYPRGGAGGCSLGNDPAQLSDIVCIIQNIISLLAPAAAIAFFVMLLIGGFQFLSSGGDPKSVGHARTTLTIAIIGIILVVVAWLILNLVKVITGVDVTTVSWPF